MDFQMYKLKSIELENCFTKLKKIADDEGAKECSMAIESAIEGLKADDFKVVVVGEFSRGKSTFVNALLGTGLLPTSSKPTTAVITEIVYNDKKFIHVYNDEKNYTVIPEEKFEEFKTIRAPKESLAENEALTEKEKIDKIYKLLIHYPVALCKNKVMMIDTPGLNDTNVDREEITKNYLKQADAAIMLMAANQILTKSEEEFISFLTDKEDIKDIFFVLNFKDQAQGEEQKILDYINKNLGEKSQAIGLNKRIYLVNSKGALVYRRHNRGENVSPKVLDKHLPNSFDETGFVDLEKNLEYFLVNEKGKIKIKRDMAKLDQKIRDLRSIIINKTQILMSQYEEVVKKFEELQPKFTSAKNDTDRLIDEYSSKAKNKVDDLMSSVKKREAEAKKKIFNIIDDRSEDSLTEEFLNDEIRKILSKSTDQLKQDLENIQKHDIALLEEEYYQKLVRIWKNIDRECRETFESNNNKIENQGLCVQTNVSLGSGVFSTGMSSSDKAEIAPWLVGGGIGLAIAGAPLLPIVAVGAFIAHALGFFDNKKRKIRNKVNDVITEFFEDLKINLGNNYSFYIRSRVESMTKEFKDRIVEMEEQLILALEEKEKSKEYTDSCIARLDNSLCEVNRIKEKKEKIMVGVN